ncbi:MAG: hypothetical protein A49_19880 [Methyloceanibacter sp.]|nr:MAG: hypothetical protein A49_19880 [Methyloceanibacter sp.]
MKKLLSLVTLAFSVAVFGCEKAEDKHATKEVSKPAASNPPAPAKATAPKKEEPGHEGHDHAAEEKSASGSGHAGHGGEVIQLGTSKLGAFEVRASRDKGEIKPGGDAPVDVWIDGGVGKGVTAVRFWIGTEDAKGSIKAKADIEDGKWHTHTEVPSPIPAGSKLWVEIEETGGKKTLGSFDLKA